MQLNALKDLLREMGVVGAGGAGFPSYAKLSDKADTIILNCAECEPLLKVHRQVLEEYTAEILSTLSELVTAAGAKQANRHTQASTKQINLLFILMLFSFRCADRRESFS
jgi:Na+-translocating ferredoxin:NAD+ oxidoreductase RnfC subunit